MLYARTVTYMEAPSHDELQQVRSASLGDPAGDAVVHSQSAFGFIVSEVRQGRIYVNGDHVEPAPRQGLVAGIVDSLGAPVKKGSSPTGQGHAQGTREQCTQQGAIA